VTQAQLLAYADDFWMLALMFAAVPLVLPFMRRIRLDKPEATATTAIERSPSHAVE
jgi:hypothetical protein